MIKKIKPLISIITPVFNSVSTIEACLASVINQTYDNKEHWIIDGGSTDGTVEIVKKWSKKHTHIHYISEKDKGLYHAMNKGAKLCKGEWLYFMGGDDVLADNQVLHNVSKHFDSAIELLLGKVIAKGDTHHNLLIPVTNWSFFIFNSINHQSCFYKRSVFNRLQYDENKRIASDYKMNLSLLTSKVNYKKIEVTICIYYLHGLSGREIYPHLKEMNQCRRELLPKINALFFISIANTLFFLMQGLKKIIPSKIVKKMYVFFKPYVKNVNPTISSKLQLLSTSPSSPSAISQNTH